MIHRLQPNEVNLVNPDQKRRSDLTTTHKYITWSSTLLSHANILFSILSTTATSGTEESGRCRELLNKSQCMDFLFAGMKNCGRCREVAVSKGSVVFALILCLPRTYKR